MPSNRDRRYLDIFVILSFPDTGEAIAKMSHPAELLWLVVSQACITSNRRPAPSFSAIKDLGTALEHQKTSVPAKAISITLIQDHAPTGGRSMLDEGAIKACPDARGGQKLGLAYE